MNVLDNIVSFISPKAGAKRAQYRAWQRMYEAAAGGRRTDGWNTGTPNQNKEIVNSLSVIRSRAKDLRKNNPYGNKAIRGIGNNVTGTGIIPAIKTDGLKNAWNAWADSTYCDFDDKLNFYGLQNLVMKTIADCGGCIIKRIRTYSSEHPKNVAPLELQILDGEWLDVNKNLDIATGQGRIIGGVEYDQRGKKIAYWIFPYDPSECVASERVPYKDILHIFEVDIPGQVRGLPFGTPSVMSLRDYDEYTDAQLIKQKVAACFTAFVSDATDTTNSTFGKLNEDATSEHIEPGIIEHLAPGKQITFSNPPSVDGFGEFSKQTLNSTAAGYGMSYEAFTGDMSKVNFSSARMGWIEYQRNIESWQWFTLIPQFCHKTFDWFVEAAELSGLIKDSGERPDWTAPRRQMLDPVKETAGLLAQVRAGFISWQEAVRQLGYQPDEILEEITKSKVLFDTAGIQPECDPRYDAQKIKQILDDADQSEKEEEK